MELEQVKALLPDSVITIAELIGFPATAELLRVLGGTTFPVGKGLRAMGAGRAKLLKETIGEENARLMTAHFGGEVLYLPRCDRALRELRNRAFLGEFENLKNSGLSTPRIMTQLCPKYGFSDRFAWGIISQSKNDSGFNQDSLF
ncbi:Mor transcription activator family protein [Candidatus Pantoea formicae]|uniref:Mor transcription activator family protein n=1 Tax=Candidatus Pantoea formicae TaxID=2608355 RepID=UPI003EDA5374